MGMYRDLVLALPEETELMHELTNLTDEFVESIKVTHPQKYNMFMDKIKGIHSHNHFTEEKLEEVYSNGELEEYYKLEHTTNLANKEFDIDFSKERFNEYDFNYIMNYHHNVYKTMHNKDVHKCAELTIAWLDSHDGKAMWFHNMLHAKH